MGRAQKDQSSGNSTSRPDSCRVTPMRRFSGWRQLCHCDVQPVEGVSIPCVNTAHTAAPATYSWHCKADTAAVAMLYMFPQPLQKPYGKKEEEQEEEQVGGPVSLEQVAASMLLDVKPLSARLLRERFPTEAAQRGVALAAPDGTPGPGRSPPSAGTLTAYDTMPP